MTRRIAFLALLALLCAGIFTSNPALYSDERPSPPTAPQQATSEDRDGKDAKKEVRAAELIELLNMRFESKDVIPVTGQPLKVKELIGILVERIAAGSAGKKLLPIVVNTDNTDIVRGLQEADVAFPTVPKEVTIGDLLRLALRQIPGRNVTFVVRRGQIEIVNYSDATLKALLSQPLLMRFEDTPLDEALQRISEYGGVSIVMDRRADDKFKTPVSATFLHDSSVWSAIYLLADTAGLEAVVREDGVYITTPRPRPAGPAGEPQFHRPQVSYPPVDSKTDGVTAPKGK